MPTLSKLRSDRCVELSRLLGDAPDGLTLYQIADQMGLETYQVNGVIRDLRRLIAKPLRGVQYALTCDPTTAYAPWTYRLLSGEQLLDRSITKWPANRMADLVARVDTLAAASASAHTALAGTGTMEAREALIMHTYLERMTFDLQQLRANVPTLAAH